MAARFKFRCGSTILIAFCVIVAWESSNCLHLNYVKQTQYGSVLTPSDTLSPQYHCILMEMMLFHWRWFEILGQDLDSGLTMNEHAKRVSAGCYAILCALKKAKPFIPHNTFISLVVQFILTKLDLLQLCLQMSMAGGFERSGKTYLWIHDLRAHHTSIEKSTLAQNTLQDII